MHSYTSFRLEDLLNPNANLTLILMLTLPIAIQIIIQVFCEVELNLREFYGRLDIWATGCNLMTWTVTTICLCKI